MHLIQSYRQYIGYDYINSKYNYIYNIFRRVGEALTITANDPVREKGMIESLLVFQESMDQVLRGAFSNHVRTYFQYDII